MRAAKPAVKYFVVNQAKSVGLFKAQAVKMTVQSGNKLVAALAVLMYVSNSLAPNVFSSSGSTIASLYEFKT
jgi:hypothetical protein